MSFDFATLITDRQKSDADYARALIGRITDGTATAEELAAWNAATLKGVYDYTDLNRVTAAMDEINSQFSAAGYKTGYIPIEIHKSKLPDGYTELEYIESTGEQYIDTWFKPNQGTRVIVDAQMLVISTAFYFGARTASATINYNVLLSGSAIRSDYGESKVSTSAETATNRLVIDKSKNFCKIGNTLITNSESTFQSNYNLYLFASNDGGSAKYFATCRLYSGQVYDGNTLIRDYVPCKNPDGEYGLYDTVNLKFEPNSGTGSFLPGSEVIDQTSLLPDGSKKDPNTWYEDDKPTTVQINQYLANVRALRATIANLSPEVPEAKDMFSVEAANNIEKILLAIERAIQTMKQTYVPCGATACGGDYL